MMLYIANSVDDGTILLSGNGTTGVRLQPAIIFIDLYMPRKDGKYFLRYRKENAELRGFRVVILSSSTRQIDVDDCLRLGADYKQVKPVDWDGYQTLIVFIRQFWDETIKTVAHDVSTLS